MANTDQSRGPTRPAGAAGDGQDSYPTYHDRAGSGQDHVASSKPTDVNLPRSRRTTAGPMLLGVLAFAAVVIIYLLWSFFNVATTTDEAMSPGDAAAPAASGPAVPGAAVDSAEPAGTGEAGLDRDVQPETGTPAPGGITAAPGAADVPGGATTDRPAPAQ